MLYLQVLLWCHIFLYCIFNCVFSHENGTYYMRASSKGAGESAHAHRLATAFAGRTDESKK